MVPPPSQIAAPSGGLAASSQLSTEFLSYRNLCVTCSKIPFATMALGGVRPTWDFGNLEAIWSRLSCPFCALVRSAIEDAKATHDLPLFSLHTKVYVTWSFTNRFFFIDAEGWAFGHSLYTRLRFTSGSNATARILDKSQIDLSRPAVWLRDCLQQHESKCPRPLHKEDRTVSFFRVIDVVNMCIVDSGIDSVYLALSYVWGKAQTRSFRLTTSTRQQLQQPGSLGRHLEALPRTIRDAIELTRRIGVTNLLWIDALCLIQDEPEDMAAGIQIMDTIYEQALCTIVVANGDDADHGIHGVLPTSRIRKQPTYEVAPELHLVQSKTMEDLIKGTKYSSRAWTFQEYALSRRRLVIVGGVIYLQCRTKTWSEDVLDHAYSQQAIGMINLFQDEFQDESLDVYNVLTTTIFHYSSRQMTHSGDVLNAMSGIMRRIGRTAGTSFLMGIPVNAFDLYLLFTTTGDSISRRQGFPSWSWCGWVGKIFYNPVYTIYFRHDVDGKVEWTARSTWTQWWKRSPSDGLSPVWEPLVAIDMPQGDLHYPYSTRCLPVHHLPASLQQKPMPSMMHPGSAVWKGRTLEPARPYPLLHFWAVSAKFKCLESRRGQSDLRPDRRVRLYDVDEQYVGHLYLDKQALSRPSSDLPIGNEGVVDAATELEVIVLSLGSFTSEFRGELLPNATSVELMERLCFVLYIEWMSDGVAERRGLGQLKIAALDKAIEGPAWKEILLG
jgi:hypothetical protein